jgi:cobalt-zinc-cadmium efflux system membrane fusion protein
MRSVVAAKFALAAWGIRAWLRKIVARAGRDSGANSRGAADASAGHEPCCAAHPMPRPPLLPTRALAAFALPLALALTNCSKDLVSAAAAAPSTVPGQPGAVARTVKLDPSLEARFGIVRAKAGDSTSPAGLGVPGSLEYDPDAYAEVGPRLDGRVAAIHARLGDRVKKGDPLAELVVPSLAETEAAVLVAQASLKAAEKNAKREHDLFDRQLTTAREVEEADAELARMLAEHSAASTRLTAVGADSTATRGTLRLSSPIDGVVVQRTAALGAYLASSSNAFVVADTERLIAVLDVHEADLPYLSIGAEVKFRADGLPDRTFTGKLAHLDPSIGKTSRLVRARIAAPNPDGALRPGMFVRASIAFTTPVGAGITLPADAVQPLGVDDVAFVDKGGGVYELRVLRIKRRTAELVEVESGIARGESVVVEGAFVLRAEAAKQ